MRILLLCVSVFIIISCKQNKNNIENVDSTLPSDTVFNIEIEETTEVVMENNESEYDLSFEYQPESIDHMEAYLKAYIPEYKLDIFLTARNRYDKIDKDSTLVHFYFNEIKEMESVISQAMYNCGFESVYEESEYAAAWQWINQYLPYMETVWECSECSSEANIYITELLEKAKTTSGTLDDLLFNTLIELGDSDYPEIHGNAGCDYCGYSLLGDGTILGMLRKILLLEKEPILFNGQIKEIGTYIMDMGQLTVFGSSKNEVINELNEIISLRDSTSIDLTNSVKQKEYLEITNDDIIYNCTFESFMYD